MQPKNNANDTDENELQLQYATNVCAGCQALAKYDVTLEASLSSKKSPMIAKRFTSK